MRISSPLKVGISLPVFKNIVLSFKIYMGLGMSLIVVQGPGCVAV